MVYLPPFSCFVLFFLLKSKDLSPESNFTWREISFVFSFWDSQVSFRWVFHFEVVAITSKFNFPLIYPKNEIVESLNETKVSWKGDNSYSWNNILIAVWLIFRTRTNITCLQFLLHSEIYLIITSPVSYVYMNWFSSIF